MFLVIILNIRWNGVSENLFNPQGCVKPNMNMLNNISSDRARSIGYYINVLARMGRRTGCITKVQMRLIVKGLERIDDFYSMIGPMQKNIFINVVKKYCSLSEHLISSMLI